jgi:hypothetical protein
MKIYIMEFYTNYKFYFDVNHRVYLYINSCINKSIRTKNGDTDLMIIVDTAKMSKFQIGKKSKRRKNKVTIGVTLPYDFLKKSENFLFDLVTLLCDSIIIILKDFEISEKVLNNFKMKCLKEIPNNPKYIYQDEDEVALQKRLAKKGKHKED